MENGIDKRYVLLAVVVLLLVIAVSQTLQIGAVQQKLTGGAVVASAPASSSPAPTQVQQSVPTMVGGC